MLITVTFPLYHPLISRHCSELYLTVMFFTALTRGLEQEVGPPHYAVNALITCSVRDGAAPAGGETAVYLDLFKSSAERLAVITVPVARAPPALYPPIMPGTSLNNSCSYRNM